MEKENMKVSYEEALEVCIQHYKERGWDYQTPSNREEVFRVYRIIQEENERRKHIGIRPYMKLGALQVYETYWLDEEEPDSID